MTDSKPSSWRFFFSLPLAQRIAITLWITLLVALTVKTILKPTSHSVFPVYFKAGTSWWQQIDLYQVNQGLDHYRYSPTAAIFFSVFSLMGITLGAILWNLCSIGVFILGCNRLRNIMLNHGSILNKECGGFFIISLFAALSGIWNSQCNAFIIGLILLGATDLIEGKNNRAAFALAFAFMIKSTIMPILALLVLIRPFPLLPKLLLAISALLLFPFLTSPTAFVLAEYRSWYEHLQDTKGLRWPGFRDAWYGWLVFQEQLHPGNFNEQIWSIPTNFLYKLLQLMTGIATAAIVFYWRTRVTDKVELIFRSIALGTAWILLFGPASEFPTFGFIAPFLGWAWLERKTWNKGEPLLLISLVLILVLGWQNFTFPLRNHLPILLSALPTGTICFALWLIQQTNFKFSRGLISGDSLKDSQE
ncbi:MAG: DUF2029 domain-containing protein [Planctomycetes bacterium]|nr:DUF2029 domain-containing protein [Planctomycetota bacterium]